MNTSYFANVIHKSIDGAPAHLTQKPRVDATLFDISKLPVDIIMNENELTSDAGALLLFMVEQQIGIIRDMAAVIPDKRDARKITHTLTSLLMQRILQIACGYEDANDCNQFRDDPIFKMLAGRFPEIDAALSSQPTMTRFENSVSRTTLYRLAMVFANAFVASYDKPPEVIIIDADDTEDKTFGNQQLTLFNGYYNDYCYQPMHIYEGISGKLITTILKPGKRCDGTQMLAILKRVVGFLRQHWPDTVIVFRGDGHFAYPEIMSYIARQESVYFVTGLPGNPRLMKEVEIAIKHARAKHEKTGKEAVVFHAFYYSTFGGSDQNYFY